MIDLNILNANIHDVKETIIKRYNEQGIVVNTQLSVNYADLNIKRCTTQVSKQIKNLLTTHGFTNIVFHNGARSVTAQCNLRNMRISSTNTPLNRKTVGKLVDLTTTKGEEL